FGSEGKSRPNAHFSPARLLININRGRKESYKGDFKGENSFVHEYFHFIDYIQGRSESNFGENFASEANKKTSIPKIENIRVAVKHLIDDQNYGKTWYDEYGKRYNDYLNKPIELFARLSEATITAIVQK